MVLPCDYHSRSCCFFVNGLIFPFQMKVGLPSKKNQVQVGEAVEVLVLSDIKSLSRFMAVRDVYLPEMGIWLSEDPCIERPVFEELIETLRAGSSSSPITPALEVILKPICCSCNLGSPHGHVPAHVVMDIKRGLMWFCDYAGPRGTVCEGQVARFGGHDT
jgi:hypothetical protein